MNVFRIAPALLSLTLVAGACQSPGTGGRGGRTPVDVVGADTGGSDVGGDSGGTTGTVTTSSDDTFVSDDTGPTTTFDSGGNDTVSTTCSEAPIEGELAGFTAVGGGSWSSPQGLNLQLGGSAADALVLTFESNQTGQFSLDGTTPNTCTRCIQLAVDIGNGGKSYFANSGIIQINDSPASSLDVVLIDVTFVEVNGAGSIVSGGSCIHAGGAELMGEGESCVPSCGARVCGDNGCGGSCGSCGGATTCNASGQCAGGTPTGCTTLSPTGSLVAVQPGLVGMEITSLGLGGSLSDFLQLEFYTPDTGSFNLGSATNISYATCEQCVLIYEDDDGNGSATIFFNSKGALAVSSGSDIESDPPIVSATFTNVELVEVNIDAELNTTPVPNGRCYKIANRTLSTP